MPLHILQNVIQSSYVTGDNISSNICAPHKKTFTFGVQNVPSEA